MEAQFEKVPGDVGRPDCELILRVVARCYLEYRCHCLKFDPWWVACKHFNDRAAKTPVREEEFYLTQILDNYSAKSY